MEQRSAELTPEPRPLPWWLLLGISISPVLFSWFLLRGGYSRHVRWGAFLLAGLSVFLWTLRAVSPY